MSFDEIFDLTADALKYVLVNSDNTAVGRCIKESLKG